MGKIKGAKKTIRLQGGFGRERDYTREEFVSLWTDTAGQLFRLAESDEDIKWASEIKKQTADRAEKVFDRIYQRQAEASLQNKTAEAGETTSTATN